MSKVTYNSPGVTAEDAGTQPIQESAQSSASAVIIGTSQKGPAFVPTFFSSVNTFENFFGVPYISGSKVSSYDKLTNYGQLAVKEWLADTKSVIFMRVLGAGDGKNRITVGSNAGDVNNAGYTVGEQQPDHDNFSGSLSQNPYANSGGVLGRTYFLGCFMSQSAGSNLFNGAGLQGDNNVNGIGNNTSVPILRGILMAPSGVILRLSASVAGQDFSISSAQIANDLTAKGTTLGSIKLFDENSGQQLQQFVLLLNGHKGSDEYPNVLTASLDMQSPSYITKVLNTTASLIQQAGHYLAAHWDIYPTVATLTGVGVVAAGAGAPTNSSRVFSTERSVFLLTSSLSRDTGSSIVPNFEGFKDRFSYASTPWIISQKFYGKHVNLFKLHSLHAGEQQEKYKIIIHDITPYENESNKLGTFSLSIRNMYDIDETSAALEKFNNLSLNPSSERYISKVIGDVHKYFDFDRPEDNQKIVVEGNYPNNSKYVRVEVSNEVANEEIPQNTIPTGFRGIPHIITSGSAVMASLGGHDATALLNSNFLRNLVTPPLPFSNNIVVHQNSNGNPSSIRRWGIKFDHIMNVNQQNSFKHLDNSITAFSKYFPNHSTNNINFSVSDNQGTPDTLQLGIVDVDRFCNNIFTLENIKIVTSSNGYSSYSNWSFAEYIRNGNIQTDDENKTRRINVNDFKDETSRNFLSFQTMMCGGFDGVNIFEKNEFNLTNKAIDADLYDQSRGRKSAATTAAYLKSLEIVRNTTLIDTQLLAIPGIRSPIITDEALDVAESRLDTLFLMDIEQIDDNDEQIYESKILSYNDELIPNFKKTIDNFEFRSLNSSFGAAYYPDVELKVDAPTYGIDRVIVPPTVAAIRAFSFINKIQKPWSSPTGNFRGGLTNVFSTVVKLSKQQIDYLYQKNINFLYAPTNVGGTGAGIVIGGQKTLNKSTSPLSRVNVRNLLLTIRRQIRDIATKLVFEQDRDAIIAKFTSQAGDVLSSIQQGFGLEEYKIEIDTNQASQFDIDNQTIRGKIYIKPIKSVDYLSLDFIVSNNLQSEI